MKPLFWALCFLVGCGSADGGGADSVRQAAASGGSGGGEAVAVGAAGEAGAPAVDPNTDKLMGPCGPLNCPVPPDQLDWQLNPGAYGCYEGICTVRCGPQDWNSSAAFCKSLGGNCVGSSADLLTCQR